MYWFQIPEVLESLLHGLITPTWSTGSEYDVELQLPRILFPQKSVAEFNADLVARCREMSSAIAEQKKRTGKMPIVSDELYTLLDKVRPAFSVQCKLPIKWDGTGPKNSNRFLAQIKEHVYLQKEKKETGCFSLFRGMMPHVKASLLMKAALHGLEECVEFLIQNGADCGKMALGYMTALHSAVANGNLRCIEMLLEKTDASILRFYSLESMSSFPSKRPQHIWSPLHIAIYLRRHDALKLLLKCLEGPNDSFASSYRYVNVVYSTLCDTCHEDIFCRFPKLPRFITSLGIAAHNRNGSDIMASLLAAGAEINPKDFDVICPLMVAICEQNVQNVEFLLVNGADPNGSERLFGRAHQFMLTRPQLGVKMMRLLLKYGLDVREELNESFEKQHHCKVWQEPHHEFAAVFQEFFSAVVLHKFIRRLYRSAFRCNRLLREEYAREGYVTTPHWVQRKPLGDDDIREQWEKVFKASENLPTLSHLCRMQIRQSLIDGKSDIFPFTKRVEMLGMPEKLTRFLAYE